MNPPDRLNRAAMRATAADPARVGHWLARHQYAEELTDDGLATKLGTDGRGLALVAVCETPRTATFAADVTAVAAAGGADPSSWRTSSGRKWAWPPGRPTRGQTPSRTGRLAGSRPTTPTNRRPRRTTMTPPWIERLAAGFWDRVGSPPPPPRDVEAVAALAAPIWVRSAHPVTPAAVRDWLRRRGRVLPPGTDDQRPLAGCVVAHRGWCVVVIDDRLAADERRVVVAHEVGHFLGEYLWPRERVLRRLGPGVRAVLDGDRPATAAENGPASWPASGSGSTTTISSGGSIRPRQTRSTTRSGRRTPSPWNSLRRGGRCWRPRTDRRRRSKPPSWNGTGCPGVAVGYARRLARVAGRTRPPSQTWGLSN